MANEIQVRTSLQIRKVDAATGIVTMQFQSQPTSFLANFNGSVGETPGGQLITSFGTNIDLSKIQTPGGFCFIQNQSPTETVEYGPYDLESPSPGRFLPFGELLPGEFTVFRLSSLLGQELGTGSGTAVQATGIALRARVKAKAVSDTAVLLVKAFDA